MTHNGGKCSKCGKRRVIEYVCLQQMDLLNKPMYGFQLCKKCTNSDNKCRHRLCRANYSDDLDG